MTEHCKPAIMKKIKIIIHINMYICIYTCIYIKRFRRAGAAAGRERSWDRKQETTEWFGWNTYACGTHEGGGSSQETWNPNETRKKLNIRVFATNVPGVHLKLVLFFFSWPHLWHMEFFRLGVELDL